MQKLSLSYYAKSALTFLSCIFFTLGSTYSQSVQSKSVGEETHLKESVYVIKNVNIIPMTLINKVVENATVVIIDSQIHAINGDIPQHATVIEGEGKWLIPGLIDMHTHGMADVNFKQNSPTKGANFFVDTQDVMTPFIANGVTAIFDLKARGEIFAQRNEILEGSVIGPRMALAKLINGGDGDVGNVKSASNARQAVRSAKAEGYNFIKVYSQLSVETFLAIVDEAKKQDLKVTGHIPYSFKGRHQDAFVENFGLIAHAEELGKFSKEVGYEDALRLANLAKENNSWVTATLISNDMIARQARSIEVIRELDTLKYMHPIMQDKWVNANRYFRNATPELIALYDEINAFNKLLVKAFKQVGVPIVAGTDAPGSGLVPGFSLHQELELLVDAGLTPEEALASSTRLPATWLGIDSDIGTVEVGKSADLILLEQNPLNNIKHTQLISGVFVNGQWLEQSTINKMLSNLAKKNKASLNKFKWKDRRTY